MFLWGLYALNHEHLMVAKALAIARSIPKVRIHGMLVDAVLVSCPKATEPALAEAVAKETYPDGQQKFKIKREKVTQSPDDQPAEDAPFQLKDASGHEARPKLCVPPKASLYCTQGDPNAPSMFKSFALGPWLEEPHFTRHRLWKEIEEEPGIGRGGDDEFAANGWQRLADAIAANGWQAYVAGQGGTGKSHWLKLLVKRAREAGWEVDVIAFTHVQAANLTCEQVEVDGQTVELKIHAQTILHYLHANAGCKRRLIIVDEISMIPLRLWAALAAFRFVGCRFVCMGDVAGQIPPITDQHRLGLWRNIDESRFMKELCGGLRITLRKFRRHPKNGRPADYGHFCFVGSIYPPPGSDEAALLPDALHRARKKYPIQRNEVDVDLFLCATNDRRIDLNRKLNVYRAPEDAIEAPSAESDAQSQKMLLWPGLELQGCVIEQKGIYNGLRYRVQAVDQDVCSVREISDDGKEKGDAIEVAIAEVSKKLWLAYAVTYDSSQARTYYGKVRLVETWRRNFTLRKLIVGLGRAPESVQLEVE